MIRSIVVLIVLTTACTGKQRVDLPSVYGVPGVSRIGFPDPGPVGACPEISGFFELEPEVWQVRKGGITIERGSPQAIYDLLPVAVDDGEAPYAAKTPDELPVDTMFLELDVVSGTIVVSRRAASGNAWERQFTRSAHQFQCDQGVVEFPKLVNHGYSEAGMLNYQERVILAPRSDGTGLFFVRSYGPYKGYANEPSAGFRHEFYFYRRVERSTGWH